MSSKITLSPPISLGRWVMQEGGADARIVYRVWAIVRPHVDPSAPTRDASKYSHSIHWRLGFGLTILGENSRVGIGLGDQMKPTLTLPLTLVRLVGYTPRDLRVGKYIKQARH